MKLEPGTTLRGLLCGKMKPLECHWVNESSKPCRSKITGGRLTCYCQQEPHSLRTIGYVPIETRDREQLVVIVPKTTALTIKTFVQGDALEFMRGKRDKSPTRVRTILPEEIGAQRHKVVAAEQPREISRYLLHLWGDLALQKHFEGPQDPIPSSGPNLLRQPRKQPNAKASATQKPNHPVVNALLGAIGQPPSKQ
ncbi:MAG: hypothetical protein JOZ32_20180 [Bryobacterales bacterium]|nr:hypothetical protein [Bryobacterales bacterium]